ncbi:MAG: phenylalanine--tRNA ligase subunit beta [Phycisphaerales bacterium]
MDISLRWINQYLSPADVTVEEFDDIMTKAGLPIEGLTPGIDGDTIIDIEVTSNRGDCLGHLGVAREIAAAQYATKPRQLLIPELKDMPLGAPIGDELSLDNQVPDKCPLFTARLIRNVKVGPSPKWLKEAIESFGQRSINNVVDVTNYITLELGNPCHVFDHAKLAGKQLVVRPASDGEVVNTLYAGEHKLNANDIVVADANGPQSLAGIIGGHDSQVDENTTTVVFEMATWDTVTVRNTGRKLNIRTDAAFRFERGIDPRSIDYAARRAVQLICETSGGQLAEGVLSQGAPLPTDTVISLRPQRCDRILGIPTAPEEMAKLLNALSFKTTIDNDGTLQCTIPPFRSHDVKREIDLIEEVARARSLNIIPIQKTLPVTAREPQESERAMGAIAKALTGMGFFETITFSFTSPKLGKIFQRQGTDLVAVDDDRRKAEPTLRPSVLLGLLACRHTNQSARATLPGGIRLYEVAQRFAQDAGTTNSNEQRVLAMLMDVDFSGKKAKHEDIQHAIRIMRGSIEAIVHATFGTNAKAIITPAKPEHSGFDPNAHATVGVELNGQTTQIGSFGPISEAARKAHDLDHPLVGAELILAPIINAYPPISRAERLPEFPGIDRDLSLIVDESVRWSQIESAADGLNLDRCVGHNLIGIFRGKQLGEQKKSVTVRLHFRDDQRTLRHEEVDPQIALFANKAKEALGAEIRS